MKKEIMGLTLAGSMVLGIGGCATESAQSKHQKAVASASVQATNRVMEARSVYQTQYLPYLGKLGLKCVNALNVASAQDDADSAAGTDAFTKQAGAALIAGDCPAYLTFDDRVSLYKAYHAGVGDPLRDLIKEGALKDGTLSAAEINTYRSRLAAAYLSENVSNTDSGEYMFGTN